MSLADCGLRAFHPPDRLPCGGKWHKMAQLQCLETKANALWFTFQWIWFMVQKMCPLGSWSIMQHTFDTVSQQLKHKCDMQSDQFLFDSMNYNIQQSVYWQKVKNGHNTSPVFSENKVLFICTQHITNVLTWFGYQYLVEMLLLGCFIVGSEL